MAKLGRRRRTGIAGVHKKRILVDNSAQFLAWIRDGNVKRTSTKSFAGRNRRRLLKTAMAALTAVAVLLPYGVQADISPVGRWKVIDDKGHKPVAIMKIVERNGEYLGQIVKVIPQPGDKPDPICSNCPGELKGSPIEGLTIMQGLKKEGDEYDGGTILDPDSGNYYSVKMSLGPDGNTLKVRGYLGFSLLGRTQTWYRVASSGGSSKQIN